MTKIHSHYCPNCAEHWECGENDELFEHSVCDICLEEVADLQQGLYDDGINRN